MLSKVLKLKSALAGGNLFAARVELTDYNNSISCGIKFYFRGEPIRIERTFEKERYAPEFLPLRTFFIWLDHHLTESYRLGALSLPYVGRYEVPEPTIDQFAAIHLEAVIKLNYHVTFHASDVKVKFIDD